MLSDADYRTLKEYVGIIFQDDQLCGEHWECLCRMKNDGLVSVEYTGFADLQDPTVILPPAKPRFSLLPSGIDAIAAYESCM